jgi:hypothetical protein
MPEPSHSAVFSVASSLHREVARLAAGSPSRPGIGALKLTPKSVRSILVIALKDDRVAPNVSGENPFTVTSRVTGRDVPRIVRSPSIK